MNRKFNFGDLRDGFWGKVMVVSSVLFFVYLGDAILSDWVPAYIQSSMGSSLMMGIVISFSSVIGFLADMVFPQVLKGLRTRKLMLLAIITSLVFCGVLLWSISWPLVILFLISMAIWGIYYEFLGFGSAQFVSESVPATARSGVWAIMGTFRSLAYFLGPILGSWLAINRNDYEVVIVAAICVGVGYIFWLMAGRGKKSEVVVIEHAHVNIFEESKHWWVLMEHVWPVLVISLAMGIVDATFWTTGTVLSDNLAKSSFWGGMFLPLYMMPMVFMGVVVAKWGVYKGKKKIAEIFMLVAGLFLFLMGFRSETWFLLLMSLGVGTSFAVAWPMTDAVYSDIVARMGREGKHMMGLSSSTVSLAYIVGPVLVGFVANLLGEIKTFEVVGIAMMIVAVVLLFVTPKKLRLPENVISTWE